MKKQRTNSTSSLMRRGQAVFSLLKETYIHWVRSKTPRLGAALAYYMIFAIAPLFMVALALAGLWFGEAAARRDLFGQVSALVGPQGADAIQSVVAAAGQRLQKGAYATTAAVVTFLAGASGLFLELQDALNTIWNLRRKPGNGWLWFVRNRLLSFAMIMVVGFLLLVSLVVNAALSAFGNYLNHYVSDHALLAAANFGVSLGVVTLLFAMIFKWLPDVRIAWKDLWFGAFITAILFNLGKFLLGFYLGRSTTASVYGAAGSLIIVLLWFYYSTQILFFGAVFTRVYANRYGARLEPIKGAQFVTVKEVKATPAEAAQPVR